MLKQTTLVVWRRRRGASIILHMVMHIAQTGAATEIDQNIFLCLSEILAAPLRDEESYVPMLVVKCMTFGLLPTLFFLPLNGFARTF